MINVIRKILGRNIIDVNKKHFYEVRDSEIIKYDMFNLEEGKLPLRIRGSRPKNLNKGEYIACIGAAQTFGCFCEKPFPQLLQNRLNCPVLNLATGGADAELYLNKKKLLQYINNAKFVIIQVMSARGESNSLVKRSGGQKNLIKISNNNKIDTRSFYEELIKSKDKALIKKVVSETRFNWIKNYKKLLSEIKVPKILFWFSKRKPLYKEEYDSCIKLWRAFPQLVNQEMIEEINPYVDYYAECVTKRGSPQKLRKLFKKTYNRYYPSPQMHEDAANLLEPVCKKYLTGEKIYIK